MIDSRDFERKLAKGTWPIGCELQLYVGGTEPVSKGSMRAFIPKGWKRAVITDSGGAELRAYENTLRNALRVEMDRRGLVAAREQPFEVHMVFYFARSKAAVKRSQPYTKPDLDKLQRAALDAMSKLVFHDDAQVARIVVEKRYADATHDIGTWIRVRALPATLRELEEHQQRQLVQ